MPTVRRRRVELRRPRYNKPEEETTNQQRPSRSSNNGASTAASRAVLSSKVLKCNKPSNNSSGNKRLRRRQLSGKSTAPASSSSSSKMFPGSSVPSGATDATTVPRFPGHHTKKGMGMPSPNGSASETSDYQRSTPSPREAVLEEWPSSASSHREGDSDPGFSEDKASNNNKKSLLEAALTSERPLRSNSSEVKLRQVRVALEKMDGGSFRKKLLLREQPSSKRRRHSDVVSGLAPSKKSRVSSVSDECLNSKTSLSSSSSPSKKFQVQQRELFTVLRKQKLDLFLNLKTDSEVASLTPLEATSPANSFPASPVKTEPKLESSSLEPFQFEAPINPIRFPAAKTPSEVALCKWEGCGLEMESAGKLLDHLKLAHATVQNPKNEEDFFYKCMWKGCKVFGKSSSSRSWLEKHVANHGGNKPFSCIVDGCKLCFGTQSLLERHVNAHFKKKEPVAKDSNTNADGTNDPNDDEVRPSKVMRKAGKKIKFRKTIYSARIFDLFDVGIMAAVQERLVRISDIGRGELGVSGEGGMALEADLTATIVGKRTVGTKKERVDQVMLRWNPENILPDEWVPVSGANLSQTVRLSLLPFSSKEELVSSRLLLEDSSCCNLRRRRKNANPEESKNALS